MVAAIALGQLSNVMGCLTTYGIGSAPPYFGANYVPQGKWYQFGLLLSVFYLAVWLFIGGPWWKASTAACPAAEGSNSDLPALLLNHLMGWRLSITLAKK